MIRHFSQLTLLLALCTALNSISYGQAFTEQASITLTGVSYGVAEWGDYDSDGDLDMFILGSESKIYRNNAGTFSDIAAGLPPAWGGSGEWGDYDNDGDLDIILTGNRNTRIYRNNTGVFADINANLTGLEGGSASWGDFDNDGDLDVLLTGEISSTQVLLIYRNDNGSFKNINAPLTGINNSSAALGDYDNDGDLDILVTGYNGNKGPVTLLIRNDGSSFTEINAGLENVYNGSTSWGDYDNDGDLDILLTGYSWNLGYISKIYRNSSGTFTDLSAGLPGVSYSSSAWGDYDNDGDLDVLISGESGSGGITRVYSNNSGTFSDIAAGLPGLTSSSVAWGDYDKDNDLDILLTGNNFSKVYANNTLSKNSVPVTPAGLASTITAGTANLSWAKSTDTQTQQNGLSYNLYIGTGPGLANRLSPMAAVSGGFRRVIRKGNIQSNAWSVKKLAAGTYYWSVQAVDNAFAGSAFAAEGNFTIPFSNSISPSDDQRTGTAKAIATLTVTESSTPSSRQWKYSTTSGGPYSQSIAGSTGTTCSSSFSSPGIYYVVCESTFGGITYTSNQVRITVSDYSMIPGLPGMESSSAAWGDYDSDGDLDILIAGSSSGVPASKVLRNDGSDIFTDQASIVLPGVYGGSVGWIDYNSDGKPDILLSGNIGSVPATKIFKNNGDNTFDEETGIILRGSANGGFDAGDFDNDGDADLVITGYDGSVSFTAVYRNDSGVLSEINQGLRGGNPGSCEWGDVDNDGDLDILLSGYNNLTYEYSVIARNDNGTFTEISPGLYSAMNGSTLGDYDKDGDLDAIIAGYNSVYVFSNNNGTFSSLTTLAQEFTDARLAWGDHDSDGDLDVLLSGNSPTGSVTRIFQNNNGSFSEVPVYIDGFRNGAVRWGDYDNDGDLDIMLTGASASGPATRIYKNNSSVSNTPPTSPSNLVSTVTGTGVNFTWNKATDAQTLQNGLSYNMYIGTSATTDNIKPALASIPAGYRRITKRGPLQGNTWSIKRLPAGNYYWSVQAVDNNFAGSAFAAEGSFTIPFALSVNPSADQTLAVGQNGNPLIVTESVAPASRQWKYSLTSGGPYSHSIIGATGVTYTPNFSSFGTYYVVCDAIYNTVTYTSNEVKISVPSYTELTVTGLPPVSGSLAEWGDYDNDGDMDVLIAGYPGTGSYIANIYNNNAGTFTDISAGLTGVQDGSAAWGDYDNDNDLDILLTGYSTSGPVSKIYNNNSGTFADSGIPLTAVSESSVKWGDYDNDGDLDILLTGNTGSAISTVYRNDSGTFTDIGAGLTATRSGSAEWGDYDNDSDLDILLTGNYRFDIFKNNKGLFSNLNLGLPGMYNSNAVWGDYDNDGDLDIFMGGYGYARIYRNDNGIFSDIQAGLTALTDGCSAVWGDCDNDGDLDLLVSGNSESGKITRIYRNNNGTFVNADAGLTGIGYGVVSLIDYDNDRDLDILISGEGITKIYRNNITKANTVPSVPSNTAASVAGTGITFTWDKPADTETSLNALTYNIYVGTSPGSFNRRSPMSALTNGFRKISERGQIQGNTWYMKNPGAGIYYWAVQAIDNSFSGSGFSGEGTFTIEFSSSLSPSAVQNLAINQTGSAITVNESSTPSSRQWKYSTTRGGPYDQVITGQTGTSYSPVFSSWGTYYIVCESVFNSKTYTSSEVQVNVIVFSEQTGISLPGLSYSSADWGDYDNDGDQDLLLTGSGTGYVAKIYNNNGGAFTDIGASLSGVNESSCKWGDYDNDNDLDIILMGYSSSGRITKIYNNNAGVFTEIPANLPGATRGSANWMDYDNDGDQDIILTGYNDSGEFSKIFRNDGGTFSDINAGLTGIQSGNAVPGDYDNDGDPDLAISGSGRTLIYRNDNGNFTDINAGLPGNWSSQASWGDFDNDGDLDLLSAGGSHTRIYRNDNGIFNDLNAGLPALSSSSACWADYDNDGDLDLFLNGSASSNNISEVYRNDAGVFVSISAGLYPIIEGNAKWGDYDKDNDLDLVITGNGITKIYKNNISVPNTAPTAPSGLSSGVTGLGVVLVWNKSTDAQTLQNGLSYNIYIGTTAGSSNKKSPMAVIPGGYRKVTQRGMLQGNSVTIKKLTSGTYYWNVQAVDNSFAGSPFATEGTFNIPFSSSVSPVNEQVLAINQNGTLLTVSELPAAASRQWKYSTVSGGPYSQSVASATGLTYTPRFSGFGTFYVVCESVYNGVTYQSNEIKVSVPPFTEQTAISLAGAYSSAAAWGDYDNDGDKDILITGYNWSGLNHFSAIYANNSGVFTDIGSGLTGVSTGSVDWYDYDNDGDIDILLTGYTGSAYISKVYNNNAGTFTDINAGLPGVRYSSAVWGDYDNDGDGDILLTGYTGSANVSNIYRNDNGVFTNINAGLTGVIRGSAEWGDYDNDGDLDILLTGNYNSIVYRNDKGIFTNINASLDAVSYSASSWNDYDNDGDLDILITGVGISKIYRNDDGLFSDIQAGLPGIQNGSVAWGDLDNDGDADLILSGSSGNSTISEVYINNNGTFTDIDAGLTPVGEKSSSALGDYDNDGDLDILLVGRGTTLVAKIYRNNSVSPNTPPSTPSNLAVSFGSNKVIFSWNKSSDTQTAQNGISYNLYVGTAAGLTDKRSPNASVPGGMGRIVRSGPVQGNSWFMTGLGATNYYWSVQAIDKAFAGSAFAAEGTFSVPFTSSVAPVDDQVLARNQTGAVLTVTESSIPASRQWKYSAVSGGPYDQSVTGATNTTWSPSFAVNGTYYVVCESFKDGVSYVSNQVRVNVTDFVESTGTGLPGISVGSTDWGDYDNDGDLDLLVTGSASVTYSSAVYNNNAGTFTDILAGLPGVNYSSVAWGDYDNDGDLDILLTGRNFTGTGISVIYRNDNGVFNDINAGLAGVYRSSASWADYDNDGDLDVLISGMAASGYLTKIYRNDSGTFTDIKARIIGLYYSSVSWSDYDNDGDLDFLITGTNGADVFSKIYRNNSGTFTELNTELPLVYRGSVKWGDFDNDGDQDILMTGNNISEIIRNDNGSFTRTNAGLAGVSSSSSGWGDYDNDGDLDIFIAGSSENGFVTLVYRNDAGVFAQVNTGITGFVNCSASWVDYDNDNDLDLLLAGSTQSASRVTKIYRNISTAANSIPSAPSGLTSTVTGTGATLSWNKSTDSQTSQNALTYNLYIGSSAGAVNIKSPMASASGFRRITAGGPVQGNSWTMKRLPAGTYYWSVQAIDNSFAGSAFAVQSTITVPFSSSVSPSADQVLRAGQESSVLTLTESSAPASRQWKYSTVSGGPYNQLITGATGLTCTVSFPSAGTYYVICESVKNGVNYSSNEVRIVVSDFISHSGFNLPGIQYGSVSWGDYDSDGDLDLLMSGLTQQEGAVSRIYRNDLGVFNDIAAGLAGVQYSSTAWGDYDNDGDPDVLLTGYISNTVSVSKIYRNDSGAFIDTDAALEGVSRGSVAWADYDNDGDLDILLTGLTPNSASVSRIYRNDSGTFTDIQAALAGVSWSSVAWDDYDRDGDQDILLTGSSMSIIYRNDKGRFTDIEAGLPGISNGSAAWTDFDSDGDPDILLAGSGMVRIFSNQNGEFSELSSSLPAVIAACAATGDFDGDGDPDFIVSGTDPATGPKTWIFRNDNSVFSEAFNWLPGVSYGKVAFADYDNDNDLDVVLCGNDDSGFITRLFNNNPALKNSTPSTPSNLQVSHGGNKTTLSWNKSTDAQTSQDGLSYNIYIGTTAGSVNRKSPMSSLTDGFRKIVQKGIQPNSVYIEDLPAGQYFWSVQSIDNSFAGSPFAAENSFNVAFSNSVSPSGDQSLIINQNGTTITVTETSAPASRTWKYARTSGGPYDQVIAGATGTSYVPNFTAWGIYYVVCESVKNGITYISNEVKIDVSLFTPLSGAGLTGIRNSSVAWGDYDNDGDQDILISGTSTGSNVTKIYRNDDGAFIDINANLAGVSSSSVAWGDYDNDNDLDILLTGSYSSRIYRNLSGIFTDINAGLPGIDRGTAAWADYDTDGDLDILLTGSGLSAIFRNDNNIFTNINAGLTGVSYSSSAWSDFDNDGDPDLLLTGSEYSKIYRNDNGAFVDINAGLTGVQSGSAAWGDFDNDGDPDILLAGYTGNGNISKIYRNDNGMFPEINAGLKAVEASSAAWGDYDNDGDPDILLTGYSEQGNISVIYRNDGGGLFTDIGAGLPGIQYGSVAWGDYDKDRDLDILLSGNSTVSGAVTMILRNNITVLNTVPTAPAAPAANLTGTGISLSWSKSTDGQTSQAGLSYNIYIGTSAATVNKKSPMSSVQSGYRRIPQKGSTQKNSWLIRRLPVGTYYWSVQAIDNSFNGSPFGTESTFTVLFTNSIGPVTEQVLSAGQNGTPLTVTESGTPVSRQWKYSVSSGGPYNQLIAGASGTSWVPSFSNFGTYYVICESSYGGINYISNEVKIRVPAFSLQTGISLPSLSDGSLVWGDYDNDGDLDLLISGSNMTRIYRNNNGLFSNINAGLPGLNSSSAAWGDYDNDNDLDILITGNTFSGDAMAEIFRNDGTFTDINAGLAGIENGSTAWGDFDNDGDLDILLSGSGISKIYRNDNGSFSELNASLPGVGSGSAVWGDYDSDGDPDVLITGESLADKVSKIYRNDNGSFTDINAGLTGVSKSSAVWIDYDSDGDLDLMISGQKQGSVPVSLIYRNDAGIFTDIAAGLPGAYNGTCMWGDFDNDGDPDLLLTGNNNGDAISRVYRNDNGIFVNINDEIIGLERTSAPWCDYDNDGDLDFVIAGSNNTGEFTKVYRNNAPLANAVPSAPSNLQASLAANKVTFTWNRATDSKTLQAALGYNLYIGSSAGNVNRKTPMASLPGGYRKVVQKGNQTNSWQIKNLPAGPYYWSVQAIDNSFAGSAFATEGTFTVAYSNSIAPVADQNLALNQQGTQLTVTESGAPTSRQWKYSTVSGGPYSQVIAGATGTTWTPVFQAAGTYYVVCVSTKDANSFISNEVRVNVFTFIEQTSISLPGIGDGSVSWCDYDNDGDLDLLLSGESSSTAITNIYRNDAGTFTNINAGLPGAYECSAAWGDYDRDGFTDLLLTGYASNNYFSRIYRNNNGTFNDIGSGLAGVRNGAGEWIDYDNDGDLDVILSGATSSSTSLTRIYRNTNGIFADVNAGLPGLNYSNISWGDYDNDGDKDLVLSGMTRNEEFMTDIFRNDNGALTAVNAGLTAVAAGSADWGDYDNDGDLDLLITGAYGENPTTPSMASKIYRNNAGIFTDISANLTGVYFGSARWGDYDNDGDIDILVTGNAGNHVSVVYRNDAGIFTDTKAGLIGLDQSSAAWGDYDNDGDLDLILAGQGMMDKFTRIYRNQTLTPNTTATAPSGLQASALAADRVRLSWSKPTDAQTPQNSLNYNLRMGTTPGGSQVTAPMSSSAGYRRIPARGNSDLSSSSYFTGSLIAGKYYWSVQAVDQAFAGGAWSAESSFTVLAAPVAVPATGVLSYSFIAKWNISAGATGYRVDVATDAAFTSMVTGYNNADAGNAAGLAVSGLSSSTAYYYRVRAYCSDGTSISSNIITVTTLINPPAVPSGLTIRSCNDLVTLTWTANTETNFSRYVIYGGTSANPVTRMDSVSSVSTVTKTFTGLVHGQTYYFRIKAVNTGGAESQFSTQVSSAVRKGHIPVIKKKFNDLIICYNPGDSISQWQWYKDNALISGETKQYHVSGKKAGNYHVVTTDRNGCVNPSNTVTITPSTAMVVYPNPASSNFMIMLNSEATGEAVISLYNSSGAKVLERQTVKNDDELIYEITGGYLQKGIYTIEIVVNEDEISHTPVVIIK